MELTRLQKKIVDKVKPIRNLIFLIKQNSKLFTGFTSVIILTAIFGSLGIGSLYPIISLLEDGKKRLTYIEHIQNILHFRCGDEQLLTLLFVGAGIVFLISGILYVASYYLQFKFTESLKVDWQAKIFDTYLKQKYDYFVKNRTGDLIQKQMVHTETASSCVRHACQMARDLSLVFFLVVMLCLISYKLTLLVWIFMVIMAVISLVLSKIKIYTPANEHAEMQGQAYSLVTEVFTGIRQVKLFLAEEFFAKKLFGIVNKKAKIYIKISTLANVPMPLIQTVVLLGILFSLFFVVRYREQPKDIIPLITVFGGAVYKAFGAASGVYTNFMEIARVLPSVNIVANLLTLEPKAEEQLSIHHFENDLTFKNVCFSYNQSEFRLSDINFTIKKGKFYGVVGPSGSGKSTLADLIVMFYKPQRGMILSDNTDLNEINVRLWRSQIGFISQETFVFNGTIEENISFGKDVAEIDRGKIINAAKVADIHSFIEKIPEGYRAPVGERGLKLSGGQRQRLAIARAVYREPEIYIFDEATSSLDAQSEKRIQGAIENLAQTKTVIAITHRLSTVVNADQILVMREGQIVEVGNHQELLAKNGFYAELYEAQSLQKQDEHNEIVNS